MAEGWDMHEDTATRVPPEEQLKDGVFLEGTVVCHHPFGLGVYATAFGQYGHIDVPFIRDGVTRGPEDYPAVGQLVGAVVLGYDGHGQLRLTMRLHDLPGYDLK